MTSGYFFKTLLVLKTILLLALCCQGNNLIHKPMIKSSRDEIYPGITLRLSCNLGPGWGNVTWYKDGHFVSFVRRYETEDCGWESEQSQELNIWVSCSQNSVDLSILAVTEVGNWTCENVESGAVSDPFILLFSFGKGKLKPVLSTETDNVIPGGRLGLDCRVRNDVRRIIWYHSGSSVADIRRNPDGTCRVVWHKERRFSTSCVGNSSMLIVDDVTRSDGRWWYCYDSTHSFKSNRVNVNVLYARSRPIMVSWYTETRLGSRVNLTCALPYSSSSTKWTWNGNDFADISSNYGRRCTVDTHVNTTDDFAFICGRNTITVSFLAGLEHNGSRWRCTDTFRKTHSKILVLDVSLPSIWPTEVKISGYQGSTSEPEGLKLTCSTQCDQRYYFLWHTEDMSATFSQTTFDSKLQRCSQVMTLHPDWTYNGKTVRCLVTNKVSQKTVQNRVNLEIQYPPVARVRLELQKSNVGKPIPVLVCHVRSNPSNVTFSKWKHLYQGQLIRELEGDQTGTEYSLEIPQPSFKDRGVYVCTVTNDLLRLNGSDPVTDAISFGPKGAPEFLGNNVLDRHNLNSYVTLSQDVISNPHPPEVTWLHNGKPLGLPAPGFYESISKSSGTMDTFGEATYIDSYKASLTLDKTDTKTLGAYALKACNKKGCVKTKEIEVGRSVPGEIDEIDTTKTVIVLVPEEEEEEEEKKEPKTAKTEFGYQEILAFTIMIGSLALLIVLVLFVVIKERTGSRRRSSVKRINPDIVSEASRLGKGISVTPNIIGEHTIPPILMDENQDGSVVSEDPNGKPKMMDQPTDILITRDLPNGQPLISEAPNDKSVLDSDSILTDLAEETKPNDISIE